jgi:hypothetical protein
MKMRKRNVLLTSLLILTGMSYAQPDSKTESENPLDNQNYVYSEESLEEYLHKAAETKPMRVRQAFEEAAAQTGRNGRRSYSSIFAALWLGKDLDQMNETLFDIITKSINSKVHEGWSPSVHQWHYHMYYAFGAKGNIAPGRLYPETEKALLELLWKQMKYKNDIHWAREST